MAEPNPPKRRHLDEATRVALEALVEGVRAGSPEAPVRAAAELAGWAGVHARRLPVLTGLPPGEVREGIASLREGGGLLHGDWVFAARLVIEARDRILAALSAEHEAHPARPVVALERLRAALPDWSSPLLAEAVLMDLASKGRIDLAEGGARLPGFAARLLPDQEKACGELLRLYSEAALSPPFVHELPPDLARRADLGELLRHLETAGALRAVADGLFFSEEVLEKAERDVITAFAGRTDLGPADFRTVLPVSRKHLIPLLVHFDGRGVTVRRDQVRDVPHRG